MTPAPAPAEPPHARRGLVLALTTGAVSMTLIDMTAAAVALPTLQDDLNITPAGRGGIPRPGLDSNQRPTP